MKEYIAKIIENIKEILKKKEFAVIAIDGRCCSGKTTLANELGDILDANVIHMDDFFLRPHQRTPKRLEKPGENVDYERFFEEVLQNVCKNVSFSYSPYDCKTQSLKDKVSVNAKSVTIIEGAYSCHLMLREYYDYVIFMDIDSKTQMERIVIRNGKNEAQIFENRWIPMEEMYLRAYPTNADIRILNNGEEEVKK